MAYFVLSRNGEESLNTLLSPDPEFFPDPDPDHPRGEDRATGIILLALKKIKSIGVIVNELRVRTDKQTDRQTQMRERG